MASPVAVTKPKFTWGDTETATLLRVAIDKRIFEKFDGEKVSNRQVSRLRHL